MAFMDHIPGLEAMDIQGYFDTVTPDQVMAVIHKAGQRRLNRFDLLNLISPAAESCLEEMAQVSQKLTQQYFGRTILLFAPIYISDYCANLCTYCGFNANTDFPRTKLTIEEIETEAKAIAAKGIRHILVLTGEAPAKTPMSYLTEAVGVLRRYFSSVALEMFPMSQDDYQTLAKAGADSVTVYQETYDRSTYKQVHLAGKKADYEWRLGTPERGAAAGFRGVNIGPLFGLGKPRFEAFMTAMHARYMEDHFPHVEVAVSLPRMTHAEGGIPPQNELSDLQFVQFMLAFRLFMPRLGITVSTRESAAFRDRLVHLGVTKYSAGSHTDVGGYAVQEGEETTPQFEVTDTRSVDQVCAMIETSGYQPVFKDWEIF